VKLFAKRIAVCLALVLTALAPLSGAAAQQSEPQAWDGQHLSDQPSAVQAVFKSVWGDAAAQHWAVEHSTALLKAAMAPHGVPVTATTVIPDAPPVAADTTWVPLGFTKTHAPVTGDLIDVDQMRHKLYVGHAATDTIEQYDVSQPNPQWDRSYTVPGGLAGILIAPDIQKVFGGSPNGLAIVDVDPSSPNFGQLLNTISIGPGGSDELDYDPIDHKVYFTDVGDGEIGVADAVHNSLIKTFTGIDEPQIEQPRYNPADGMIYVAYRSTNRLAKFDPRSDTQVSVTPLGVPCTPSGVAIKPTTNMALLGCRAWPGPGLVFWNLATNSLDHTIPNVTGVDGAIYNAKADRFFAAASRWHRGPVMAMMDGSGNFITNVPTTSASHQVGYDQVNRVVYALGGGLVSFTVPF
jgi:DNA-binding beta-propeller fold protein YncE